MDHSSVRRWVLFSIHFSCPNKPEMEQTGPTSDRRFESPDGCHPLLEAILYVSMFSPLRGPPYRRIILIVWREWGCLAVWSLQEFTLTVGNGNVLFGLGYHCLNRGDYPRHMEFQLRFLGQSGATADRVWTRVIGHFEWKGPLKCVS